jgi:hypothetical protein
VADEAVVGVDGVNRFEWTSFGVKSVVYCVGGLRLMMRVQLDRITSHRNELRLSVVASIQSFKKTTYWTTRMALQRHSQAQFLLGRLHRKLI